MLSVGSGGSTIVDRLGPMVGCRGGLSCKQDLSVERRLRLLGLVLGVTSRLSCLNHNLMISAI